MSSVFIIGAIIIFQPNDMVFATDRIWENSYFKPTITDEKNPDIEAYMINALNSVRNYKSDRPFYKYPKVDGRYTISNLPCVKLYLLDTGIIEYFADFESNYQYVFFNKCDSSIYFLGGGTESFSKIISQFLTTKLDKKNVLSLIDLYLNTQSFSYPYFIIGSFEDFEEADPAYEYFSKDEYREDSTTVSRVVKPPEIYQIDGQIGARIYTWEQSTGDLEFWHFRISNQKIEIIEKHDVAKGIGRYQKWRGVK